MLFRFLLMLYFHRASTFVLLSLLCVMPALRSCPRDLDIRNTIQLTRKQRCSKITESCSSSGILSGLLCSHEHTQRVGKSISNLSRLCLRSHHKQVNVVKGQEDTIPTPAILSQRLQIRLGAYCPRRVFTSNRSVPGRPILSRRLLRLPRHRDLPFTA